MAQHWLKDLRRDLMIEVMVAARDADQHRRVPAHGLRDHFVGGGITGVKC